MSIKLDLDLMMVKRQIKLKDLAEKVGITMANLSILKQNKAKAIRFSTLNAICKELDCQPGDILRYVEDKEDLSA
jgi:putative transcriptional regulator